MEEKEEEEVAKSNPAEEVSDEPDWVGQVYEERKKGVREKESKG